MKINNISKFIATAAFILSVFSCATTAQKPRQCKVIGSCEDHQTCMDHKCINVCDLTNGIVVKNAICTASYHSPHWECPEGYNGMPFRACTKTCIKDIDCAYMDVCMEGQCVPGCSTITCQPPLYCLTLNNYANCY